MLRILECRRTLRFTRPGRLVPWLGPALRGLIARRFKMMACRHDPEERDALWVYCKGCLYNHECPYGSVIEPDPVPGAPVFVGQEDAIRPYVIDPSFPAPDYAEVGTLYSLRVVFIGERAAQHVARFWEAVRIAGEDPENGLGVDGVLFQVSQQPARDRWLDVDLPRTCEQAPSLVPAVEVCFNQPLFLRDGSDPQGRRMILAPSFSDLLRAALRCLGRLAALYDRPLEADFAGLKAAGAEVSTEWSEFRIFEQRKTSHRTGQRGWLRGIVGRAVYRDVPAALIPWIYWAGRLHVGLHRVAGAGGWTTRICDGRDAWQPRRRGRLQQPRRRRPPYRHRLH